MKTETTYISFYLKSNTIRIFKKTIRGLGMPKFIRFRVNPEGTSMLLEEFDRITLTSFRIPKNIDDIDGSMEVHSKPFSRIMAFKQGWDVEKSYRIPGKVIKHQKVAVFDLTQAVQISEDNKINPFLNLYKGGNDNGEKQPKEPE